MRALVLTGILVATSATGCSDDTGAPPIVPFTVPTNPHLASSTWPIFHRDSYAQHSSELPGVEGRGEVSATIVPMMGMGFPVFTLFDGNGDIIAVLKTLGGANLAKVDRETLTIVDIQVLPSSASCAADPLQCVGGGLFGGAYGYVDDEDRAVMGVGTTVQRWNTTVDPMVREDLVDVSSSLGATEVLAGITVLYSGEILFVGDQGTVGLLPADIESSTVLDTLAFPGEEVANGTTVDETGGIYLVTSEKLRRLSYVGGELAVAWEYHVGAPYAQPRPGRLGIGSGTTPSLVMDDMVTITDDETSMNLRVVRRAIDTAGAPREVCNVRVFDQDEATTDNAIVVAGRTLIVEQNLEGRAGVARFDVMADGSCRRTWVSDVMGPSCVPTLSTATGLVYVYTYEPETDAWGLSGLDLATGRRRFFAEAGTGLAYDNRYAAVTVGPDQRVYIGTFAGLAVFEDVP